MRVTPFRPDVGRADRFRRGNGAKGPPRKVRAEARSGGPARRRWPQGRRPAVGALQVEPRTADKKSGGQRVILPANTDVKALAGKTVALVGLSPDETAAL